MVNGSDKTKSSPKKQETDGFEHDRAALLEMALANAAFDGWGARSIAEAAAQADIGPPTAAAAFPGGTSDLLRYWSSELDKDMAAEMRGPTFDALRIREKVAFAVNARLALMEPYKEAARRAAAYLALPTAGGLGARLAWATADAIWRGLGDASTDFNYYTKRTILMGVWTSTLMRWFADDNDGETDTQRFLEARIENVMQFEKAKTQMRKLGLDPAAPIGWLAKLRYPRGPGAAG